MIRLKKKWMSKSLCAYLKCTPKKYGYYLFPIGDGFDIFSRITVGGHEYNLSPIAQTVIQEYAILLALPQVSILT